MTSNMNNTIQLRERLQTGLTCRARWVEDTSELMQLIPAWDQLVETSIYRNPSFESNFLIPALNHLNDVNAKVLIVECHDGEPNAGTSETSCPLIGLVPLVRKRIYRLPISAVENWKHDQCFDSTPLIKKGVEDQAFKAIFEFLSSNRIGLWSMDTVSAEPEFNSLLQRVAATEGRSIFQRDNYVRAAFRPSETNEIYLSEFTSKSIQRSYRRNNRRLEKLGDFQYEFSDSHSDFDRLAHQFLQLEMSGWKGKVGTALGCNESSRQFYEEFVSRSATDGKARFTSAILNGEPIAMLSDIETGSHIHSFKTAYDEEFSAYSPGLQTEVRNLEAMHQDGIMFADSCTVSDNSTINRVWGQKVKFQNVVLGVSRGVPQKAISIMPAIQKSAQVIRETASRLKLRKS